ncbi:related to Mediator of RNA polymerase II transcription subunit 31 [Saccharomycodes ludwigii]|uniref:Mediator of RNA polymerase II transcription subunit 31 n=1 Tax=Saccharomycodes ludwigii TaxID=36035 RepID=A0A376B7U0_9ASCO|nr:hypothetical protein SCDLUD_000987 [Saccharomycodes ludwigii]KAH3903358.1 hypothetical protein SCDLUD_000987 [Saccharomycodes ludwigii]SSD60745.1 related to Mediator of RNA polymerase II transcription subunit 31 [Saccharomycodes ludwigii]
MTSSLEKEQDPPVTGSVNDDQPSPTRFEIELEFVQSFANIPYVVYLFSTLHLHKSPEFLNYLKYLHKYWSTDPKYFQCIVYPNCLHVLKIIVDLIDSGNVDEIPKFFQTNGGNIMNEMVERFNN